MTAPSSPPSTAFLLLSVSLSLPRPSILFNEYYTHAVLNYTDCFHFQRLQSYVRGLYVERARVRAERRRADQGRSGVSVRVDEPALWHWPSASVCLMRTRESRVTGPFFIALTAHHTSLCVTVWTCLGRRQIRWGRGGLDTITVSLFMISVCQEELNSTLTSKRRKFRTVTVVNVCL